MGQAGRREGVVDLGCDGGTNPEQDSRAESGFGLRHDVVDALEQRAAEGGERGARAAWPRQNLRAVSPDNAADSLSLEVLAIREAVEVLRQLDASCEAHTVAGARIDAARHPHQEPIGERPIAGGLDHEVRQHQLQPIRARAGIVRHGPDHGVLAPVNQRRHGARRIVGSVRARSGAMSR